MIKHASFHKLWRQCIKEKLTCSSPLARVGSPFLKTGAMFARFQFAGKEPVDSDMLKSLHNEGAISAVSSVHLF